MASITDAVGGLLYGNPGYNSANIDQGTQDLISKQVKDSTSQNAQDYANKDLQGISTKADNSYGSNVQSALGGATDPQMQAALQARSQRMMDPHINQLQREAQVQGIGQHAHALDSAMGGVAKQQQAQNNANEAQRQAYQNNQKMRGNIISGLFGGVGQAVGMMSGGGSNGSGSSPGAGQDWSQGGVSQVGSNEFGDFNSGW